MKHDFDCNCVSCTDSMRKVLWAALQWHDAWDDSPEEIEMHLRTKVLAAINEYRIRIGELKRKYQGGV
jgi:hypothetical protein